jgi:hypothetical protein
MRDVIMGGFGGQVMSSTGGGGATTNLTSCTGKLRDLEKANAAKKSALGGGEDSPFKWSRDGGASRKAATSADTEREKRFPTEVPISVGGQFGGGFGLDEEDDALDEMDSYLRDKLRKDGINAAALEAERKVFDEEERRHQQPPTAPNTYQSEKDKEAAERYSKLFGKSGSLAGDGGKAAENGGGNGSSPMEQWRAEVVNEHPFLHMRNRNKAADSGPRWS